MEPRPRMAPASPPPPPKDFRLDSAATSPYATAPSSPRGRRVPSDEGAAGGLFLTAPPSPNPFDLLPPATPRLTAANPFDLFQHFTSAPASPRRAAAIYAHFAEGDGGDGGRDGGDDDDDDGDEEFQPRRSYATGGSSVPFDWEERPGTPKRWLGGGVAANEAAWDTEFEFGTHVGKAAPVETLTTADELFEKGKIRPLKPKAKTADEPKIRPLKPPPGLLDGGSVASSPRSPMARGAMWSPRRRSRVSSGVDFDPFAAALLEATKAPSPSPLGGKDVKGSASPGSPPKKPAASRSRSAGWRRWRLSDLLLFRSSSDGGRVNKQEHPDMKAVQQFNRPDLNFSKNPKTPWAPEQERAMQRAIRKAAAATRRALSAAARASPAPPRGPLAPGWGATRWLCSGREALSYDVVIVGAGPAGLAAAIRLKQLCRAADADLSVCVLEKGSEVGAHVLSGNVFEPRALDELIPKWRQEDSPIRVPVSSDKFWLLTKNQAWTLPSPFDNKGNYVISLSQLVRWMATKAEDLGVEVYSGFAASEILYDENQIVTGVATNDVGIAKDGTKRETFQPGVELRGRITLLAEGCRGSLSEKIIRNHKLRERGQGQHQTYALGIKEVWEIEEGKHKPGSVIHTVGWPLDTKTYGGSFLYHLGDRQLAIGLVVALNYRNPFLSPYDEFQKFKQHPAVRKLLEGGTAIQYGARTLNEGGFQSIPYPVFPGGAIIGCSAGFLNVPKIKGTHTAMKSGMLAAEATFKSLVEGSSMELYWENLKKSWIWEELHKARNYRPAFEYGFIPGMALSALERYIFKGKSPYTLKHGRPDHEATDTANLHAPIQYPKPDGQITFDVPTSLYRSNTNHEHDQPPHLHLRDPTIPEQVNVPLYAGPESRYCPARVYEYVSDEKGDPKLQINAQNCLHCKACDIKDPKQNIEWTVPEGGGGPGYTVM